MRINCPHCVQLLQLPDGAVGRQARCKSCGKVFTVSALATGAEAETAQLVPQKSYHLQSAAGLTRPQTPPQSKPPEIDEGESEKQSRAIAVLQFVAEWLPGLFRPWVLAVSMFLTCVGFVILGVCLWFVLLGALISGCMVGGLGLIVYSQAVAMLLVGERGFLHELLAELDSTRWLLFLFLLFLPFGVLYLILRPYLP